MKDTLLNIKAIKKDMRRENLKKLHTRFQRWDILIILSIILFFQVLVIIYFSEWKIWAILDNDFFRKILIPKSEDRTFYNIAISYVAAYIFYILQVHIPAYLSYKNNISLYRAAIESEMNILEEILFVHLKRKVCKKYYILKSISDDLVNIMGTFEYDSARARSLIKEIQDKHKSNMERISAVDMDNTLKMLYRNMLTNVRIDSPIDLTFLDITDLTDEEIFFVINQIAAVYVNNRGKLWKYGFVSDYFFLTDEEYDNKVFSYEATKRTYEHIKNIRKY